jgi:hypothetical protein
MRLFSSPEDDLSRMMIIASARWRNPGQSPPSPPYGHGATRRRDDAATASVDSPGRPVPMSLDNWTGSPHGHGMRRNPITPRRQKRSRRTPCPYDGGEEPGQGTPFGVDRERPVQRRSSPPHGYRHGLFIAAVTAHGAMRIGHQPGQGTATLVQAVNDLPKEQASLRDEFAGVARGSGHRA